MAISERLVIKLHMSETMHIIIGLLGIYSHIIYLVVFFYNWMKHTNIPYLNAEQVNYLFIPRCAAETKGAHCDYIA